MKCFAFAAFLLSIGTLCAQSASEGYLPAIRATPILRTTTTAAGQPIAYPNVDQPEVTAVLVEIPPGAETGWHTHPYPAYAYVLSGELTVDFEGGKSKAYKAGDAMAEAVKVLHRGRNIGSEPVKLVMFVTGEKGLPFTLKAPQP